jgi:inhibitor of cysteine peptidase
MQSARPGRRFISLCSLFLLALPAIVFPAQSAHAATQVVTGADKGRDIQIKLGDTLEVRLASNPSTGYSWAVHPKSTALLKLNGQTNADPNDPSTPPVVGRPIVQVFTFQPKRAGDGILLLRYARPWEKPALGEEQFTLHVVIE